MDLTKVTRVEVVDHRPNQDVSRPFIAIGVENVWLALQDGDRTLKVFLK